MQLRRGRRWTKFRNLWDQSTRRDNTAVRSEQSASQGNWQEQWPGSQHNASLPVLSLPVELLNDRGGKTPVTNGCAKLSNVKQLVETSPLQFLVYYGFAIST